MKSWSFVSVIQLISNVVSLLHLWTAGWTSASSAWQRRPAAPESRCTEEPLRDQRRRIRPESPQCWRTGSSPTQAWVIKLDMLHVWGGNLCLSLTLDNNQSHFTHFFFLINNLYKSHVWISWGFLNRHTLIYFRETSCWHVWNAAVHL